MPTTMQSSTAMCSASQQSGPLLRWDEARQAFIGEWRAGDGRALLVVVSGPHMIAHVRAWQTQGSGITRSEALSISAWVESYRLWHETGQSMPGVRISEIVDGGTRASNDRSCVGCPQDKLGLLT